MKGIYKIQNTITLQIYIGLSNDIIKRKKSHISSLLNNKHDNKHLQRSFNKYGINNFQFTVLDSNKNYSKIHLSYLEKFYIKKYKSFNKKVGFNKTLGGEKGCLGYNHTKDNLIKISENNKQNKRIKVFGIEYRSISEAIRILDLKENHRTVSRRCLNKNPKWKDWEIIND